MAQREERSRGRVALFALVLLLSLMLIGWGVWGFASSVPDPNARQTVEAPLSVPVPAGTTTP